LSTELGPDDADSKCTNFRLERRGGRGEEEEAADTGRGRERGGIFELGFFFLPRSWDPRTSLGTGLEVIVELLSTCRKSIFLHWADMWTK